MANKLTTHTLLTLTLLTSLAKAEVNMKDGSYYKTWVDLEITKGTETFQLRRTYNSRSLHPGIFGYGWCSDFEKSLEFEKDGTLTLKDCKLKSDVKFKKISSKKYRALNDLKDTLEIKDKTYLRKTPSALQEYDLTGKLTTLSNHHGFRLRLSYTPYGALQSLHINTYAELIFKTDARRRHIQSVSSVGLPPVTYKYKDENLVSVTNAWKGVYDYDYDKVHNLIRVQYPDSTYELMTYNTERDWILNIQTREKCQDSFQWTMSSGTRARAKYKSSAKRVCRGRLVTENNFEFSAMGTLLKNKLRVSSKGDLDAAQ